MRYRAFISDGRNKIYDYRYELRNKGFMFTKSDNKYKAFYYKDIITSEEKEEITEYCKMRKLTLAFEHENFVRSSDYRKAFFDNYIPMNDGRYRCVYCGCKMEIESTVVDHLFPIAKAKSNPLIQIILKKMHIENINQIENLVPSCRRCNLKKSSKGGVWIMRGYFGKSDFLWIILRLFQFAILTVVIVAILFILAEGGWIIWQV